MDPPCPPSPHHENPHSPPHCPYDENPIEAPFIPPHENPPPPQSDEDNLRETITQNINVFQDTISALHTLCRDLSPHMSWFISMMQTIVDTVRYLDEGIDHYHTSQEEDR